MTNRRTTTLAALLAAASLPGVARAEIHEYVDAQIAASMATGYGNGSSLALGYGIHLPAWQERVAIETQFTTTLIEPTHPTLYEEYRLAYSTLGGYLVWNQPLAADWTARVGAGMLLEHFSSTLLTYDATNVYNSGLLISSTFLAGVSYRVAPNLRILAEYRSIEVNISHFSTGFQYHY